MQERKEKEKQRKKEKETNKERKRKRKNEGKKEKIFGGKILVPSSSRAQQCKMTLTVETERPCRNTLRNIPEERISPKLRVFKTYGD